MCAVGLDGLAYLTSADSIERLLMEKLAEKLADLRAQERHDLAIRITNAVAEAWNKGQRGS